MEFRVNKKGQPDGIEVLTFKLPGEVGPPPENNRPAPPVVRIIEPNENVVLLDRALKAVPGTVTLELQFKKPASK